MNFLIKTTLIVILFISLVQCKTQKASKTSETKTEEKHNHSSHDHDNQDQNSHNEEYKYMAARTEVDDMKSQKLDVLFYAYFKIKNGLADSSHSISANYAGSMYRYIPTVNSDSLSQNLRLIWEKNKNSIRTFAEGISNSKDVEEQRVNMAQLSIKILGLLRMSKTDTPAYVFICKDWNNKTGALWLSKKNDVTKNPYQTLPKRNCGRFMQIIE